DKDHEVGQAVLSPQRRGTQRKTQSSCHDGVVVEWDGKRAEGKESELRSDAQGGALCHFPERRPGTSGWAPRSRLALFSLRLSQRPCVSAGNGQLPCPLLRRRRARAYELGDLRGPGARRVHVAF